MSGKLEFYLRLDLMTARLKVVQSQFFYLIVQSAYIQKFRDLDQNNF